ncbi:orotidine-5'-phosphate decarboxylase [Paenibacillus doosanensis]|uniref:Orotidine 5'-phosphate decarboxylase n=1 Tax=Paenibacillus konkukensis TaxID=2020716 RepID=A0ABY4RXH6_9BACL|nr:MULTISPECIES: orotidine-5'-phosphate decarboxylase [Paenibacillus]MCS7459296.1 orotidine-5'-phosphate decarboxylase [Paenibacillus doosanensis]UQZ87090.1 Orotidine 5'-phosphate decarboxylase [Paenibacillus konkukensis]
MSTQTNVAERIMVALDYPDAASAEQLLQALQGIPCYMKVGMQLFYSAGPQFVAGLKEKGYKVFLDVKMHDIPNTVKGGSESVTRLGVDMFNVHAAGGKQMLEAALEGVDKALGGMNGASRPIVIAVTQLTSTSQTVMNEEIGVAGSVEEAVLRYARLAQSAGLQGVVASPLEVTRIKAACGSGFFTVTPGIRPAGADIGDQSRVMTPQEAFAQGTDYVVIGRPITAAKDPRSALEAIIETILI